ncbi:tetratricopeptide repeat protein [Micromonospora zingiberis]|uniref:Tetratricopeptide repeat protein n=1 Tax=Micromonospora zingiberis TaxID=2053011 RepID=A0A4R0GXA4_9ACTN|nr:tetratricopeptide repeat protein [Micromonospora zingiberis]TCC00512.1 tetratricopeptide repeat protein [Micromonospora zingiberis]
MTTGLVLDDTGFEVLIDGDRVGPRRTLGGDDAALLDGLAARYVRAVQANSDDGVFVALGRELYEWLDSEHGQLSALLKRAPTPLVFEVQGPRTPSDRAWAALRAPYELLARPGGGFLVEDELARFSVVRRLGTPGPRPALDGFRLGLAFMAASPRGQHELDFEAEEAAILRAVGDTRLDLMVEDTGDPEQLAHRLADLGGFPVLHLSCHGLNNYPVQPGRPGVPVLLLEDELGDGRPTTGADLVRLLTAMPRLVFVSACLTATAADAAGHLPPGSGKRAGAGRPADGDALVAHSLATALVSAGVPAVLGWDGSVGDLAAIVFAEKLYGQLGARADLAVAVGDARRALFESTDPAVRTDWHLARLWLGPTGGGPLVAGTRRRSLVSAVRGITTFLKGKEQVPVAAAEMFVGRRPELQQALRALRAGERAGVLLHGQGRLGKSSLAARVVDRFPDRAVAVVFGDYSAMAVLDEIAEAVRANPAARELIERRRPEVRARPEALEAVLIDLLTGPCAQPGDGQRPLLLIIDDLEQILEPDPTGPHRLLAGAAPMLAAVLRAFDPAETDSRLLLTSRYLFTLGGLESRLEPVQLRPLSSVAQRKLQRRQQALTPPDRQTERAELARRALTASGGNPGLQDLIGRRLVYGEQVTLERADAAVAGLEAYLRQGDLPSDADVRTFLENLDLDELLTVAGPTHVALLRTVTLFDLPVPAPVIEVLARQTGGSTTRLRGLGLLDVFPDAYDPQRPAMAANPLAAGRIDPLTADEHTTLAALVVEPLFAAWGDVSNHSRRGAALDLQLTRLALAADDPVVVATCAASAVRALRTGRAINAFHLGREAIALLDRHHTPVPTILLRRVADAAVTSGDGDAAGGLFDRALRQVQDEGEQDTDPLEQARVIAERAEFLRERGEPEQAEQLFRRAHDLFTAAGSEQEAAAAMGGIGDIHFRRGNYDEALRIRREIQLPVYERLGETRETAICHGKIADILYQRGDYDEALRIRRDVELPVYQRLGETRSTAITWGQIADILHQRGDYDEALRIRRDVELPVYERLGETRSTAITWGQIADILQHRGDYDEALRIRREIQLPVYERLGDTRETAICHGKIADILFQRGDFDEALRIRREIQLPAYERLGETRSTAICHGKIADILYQRGDYDEALRIRRDVELPVYERLGDTRSTAICHGKIADILYQRGDYDEALRIRRDVELPVYERLGDTRSTAITWGQIADILHQRGDYDESLRIRHEIELPVYQRLGDTRSTAICHGKIADILYQRGDYDEALRIRHEIELPVYQRLGETRSTAITWGQIADILYQRGEYDEALRIRRELQLPAYERLGDTRSTAICHGKIADILFQRGDHEEALRILRERQLPIYERLGDTRSTAITWGQVADILHQRGDYDEALRIRRDVELPVYERLGDTRSTAITWGQIADILHQRGDYDGAADLHRKRLEVHQNHGDLDGIAGAKWGLAQVYIERREYDSAFSQLVEAFQILVQLQRPDGIAVVGGTLGWLLASAGRIDEARLVLEGSLAAAQKIGMTDRVRAISELLGSLPEEGAAT